MLDGYERLKGEKGDEDVDTCQVFVSREVAQFLGEESVNDKVHVRQIGRILQRIREFGLASIGNTEQLRNEGKFSCKDARGKKITVYAAKANQLRVYGGYIRVQGLSVFVCVEAARKKRDKADQKQLARVAEILGALGDES